MSGALVMDAVDEFFASMTTELTEAEELELIGFETAFNPPIDGHLARIREIYRKAHENNCKRCGGTGYLPSYRHVERGRCFKCN
ncbi:hypothetical protein [Nocardia cyriacigeorgica]|uniref:hypothetical protein n=1 Tax=Nocardia cyriacigeorgica TaxID=135487 RepID=UPI0024551B2A|nr:hypothetical protein [Nocardia cyriacigeorgica]